jgi:hypothetical protein
VLEVRAVLAKPRLFVGPRIFELSRNTTNTVPPANPSALIETGFANLVRYAFHPPASFTAPIGPPQQRADPHHQIAQHERPLPPSLRQGRFPRAHGRPPLRNGAPCPRREPEQEDRGRIAADGRDSQLEVITAGANMRQTMLKSAMPQLVPFFFVNETTMAFILLPSLIYIFSKYILPQRVRLFAARLFISKL